MNANTRTTQWPRDGSLQAWLDQGVLTILLSLSSSFQLKPFQVLQYSLCFRFTSALYNKCSTKVVTLLILVSIKIFVIFEVHQRKVRHRQSMFYNKKMFQELWPVKWRTQGWQKMPRCQDKPRTQRCLLCLRAITKVGLQSIVWFDCSSKTRSFRY